MRLHALLVGVVLTSLVVSGVAIGAPSDESTTVSTDRVIEHRTYDRTPGDDDHVRVTLDYEVPAHVDQFFLSLPDGASVVSSTAFEHVGNEGSSLVTTATNASIVVELGTENGVPRHDLFVERDDWAVVESGFGYDVDGDVVDSVETTTAFRSGAGTVVGDVAVLGEYDRIVWHADGEAFEAVVPKTDSTAGPAAAELLRDAEATLVTGGEPATQFVFVPTDGRSVSIDDVVVAQVGDHHADVVDSGVLYSYLSSGERFTSTGDVGWFGYAVSLYYEGAVEHNLGVRTDEQFRQFVHATEIGADGPLRGTESARGVHVLASLDAEIRDRTDGNRTLQDVVYVLNERGGEVTYPAFADAVERVAGESMDGWLDRYVRHDDLPDIPTDDWHTPPTQGDGDGDGVSDETEKAGFADPFDPDTDDDGLLDGVEYDLGTDPHSGDSDGDPLGDAEERAAGTDPLVADTDGDGLDDWIEVDAGSDPLVGDTDGDGLADEEERDVGTNATKRDTDGDGLFDSVELVFGTDPTDPDSDGDGTVDGAVLDAEP